MKQVANDLILKQIKKIDIGKEELAKAVVGQEKVINSLFRAIICNGHVLLEGVPGVAKTLMVRSLAAITGGAFSRIQFTPDLLPTDIVGITAYDEKKGFFVMKGPIFGNFILGDEINRSPPKVQSALLEAMQERQVTIGKETFDMPQPFFVLATQNPIESLGTYPLPAAQMDRFLFKLNVGYPDIDSEKKILDENITTRNFKYFDLKPVISKADILMFQKIVHDVYADEKIKQYIVDLTDATRNPAKYKIELGKYIEFGGSPRASISMYISAKAEAMLKGKTFVIPEHVKTVAHDVLRHRVLINYEGQSENITPEQIIDEILSKVPIP